MSEADIEKEIQAKGLNAPRLTPEAIDAVIVSEQFYVFPGTTMTVCALTLRNGYLVTGESAAASPENFNEEIGRKIARTNARNKIWALEGYLLRERLQNTVSFSKPLRTTANGPKTHCAGFCAGGNRLYPRQLRQLRVRFRGLKMRESA
jgi:exopolyphosphatase/pppGpp-phosphohydrolase